MITAFRLNRSQWLYVLDYVVINYVLTFFSICNVMVDITGRVFYCFLVYLMTSLVG